MLRVHVHVYTLLCVGVIHGSCVCVCVYSSVNVRGVPLNLTSEVTTDRVGLVCVCVCVFSSSAECKRVCLCVYSTYVFCEKLEVTVIHSQKKNP